MASKTTKANPKAAAKNSAPKPVSGAPAPESNTTAPQGGVFSLVGQFVKDLSFECFQAAFKVGEQQPFEMNLGVGSEKIADDQFAVRMRLKAEAKDTAGQAVYIAEVEYVGVFVLKNIPAQHVAPILGIEAPSLVFPYARQVLMQAIQDGGFKPGLIQPVNFAALFMQQQQAQQAKA